MPDDKDPVFRNYKGLASFADPALFDDYVGDVAHHIEKYFPCIIEPIGSSRAAHGRFMRGLAQFEPKDHTIWLWFNLIVNAVREKIRFRVDTNISFGHHQFNYVQLLQSYPSQAVAAGLGVAALRAEFGVPMSVCQISMSQLVDLTERLSTDKDLWMFDQHDLLGACLSYA